MNYFRWQHIEFANGSNPYICMTRENFDYMKKKYRLVAIKENFWKAFEEHLNMAKVKCENCEKIFDEREVIYDGEEDMDFCPYCGEGGEIVYIK